MKKRVRPFARVDRILNEIAESHKETERLIQQAQAEHAVGMQELKGLRETQAEHAAGMQELKTLREAQAEVFLRIEQMQAKTDHEIKEMQAETDRLIKEMQAKTDRQINNLGKTVGSVNDNIGFGAETYFQTALGKTLEFVGIIFDEMYPNLKKCRHGRNCEFDAVLVNHKDVAIIDVKHRVHRNQVREIADDKARIFREFFPQYKDYNLYLGLAGLSVEDGVEEEARKYGVGILKQNGDAIETLGITLKAY